MSYILDALKKSEAERTRGVVPTLLAPQQTPFRVGIVGWLVVGALLVNAVLFAAWMYWPTSKTALPPPNSSVGASPEAARASGAPPTSAPAIPSPEPTRVAPIAATPPAASAATSPMTSPASDLATALAQPRIIAPSSNAPAAMPHSADRDRSSTVGNAAVPHYEFSTHIYASDPSKRAVTMNGKRYMEGDTLDPGVRIKEITETGVLLDLDGQTVAVDVLQDWR